MENEMTQFEKNHLVYFQQLAGLTAQKKSLEKQEKEVKSQIQSSMEAYDIQSIDNEFIKITYVESKPSVSIDLAAVKKKEPSLHEDLLKDYPKVTERKPYLKFTVR
ncbi:siphovirus Gp157 family protein [Mycobacteroides abscessus]|uniref:siphovirus Gp157 family protein n=1 Tax=unclassified Desemzia TaxID=2685243 RepID=UPI0009D19307|nr:Siphovirus Gp157 [Mycobacteroides abscessus subsp. abscessus]